MFAPLAIGAGSTILSALLKDKNRLTPEQQQLFDTLMGEARNPQGYSALERSQMLKRVGRDIDLNTSRQIGSSVASQARRGLGWNPAQATEMKVGAGRALADASDNIELASAEAARRNKISAYGMLTGLAGQSQERESEMPGVLGDIAGNSMYYWLMKNDRDKNFDRPGYGKYRGF